MTVGAIGAIDADVHPDVASSLLPSPVKVGVGVGSARGASGGADLPPDGRTLVLVLVLG